MEVSMFTNIQFMLLFMCVGLIMSIGEAEEDACSDICWSDVCEFHLTLTFGTTEQDGRHSTLHDPHIPQTPLSGGSCPDSRQRRIFPVTGDGRGRSVMLVNGQFPGPTLQVKKDAKVIIHVSNYLQTVSTTIHWHGLSMSGSQWMDGVSYITQCPIPPGHTFTYKFTASPSGTHWYHPHVSNHRRDGLYGLFVVHDVRPNFVEYPLVLSDWFERDGITDEVTDLRRGIYGKYPDPVSSLINGRGRHSSMTSAPLALFPVKAKQTYKFRSVNAASDLGYEVSVDGHLLTIISWDGADIEPLSVHAFNIFPGERIDFLINTTSEEGSLRMKVKSLSHGGDHHIHDMSEEHHRKVQNEDVQTHGMNYKTEPENNRTVRIVEMHEDEDEDSPTNSDATSPLDVIAYLSFYEDLQTVHAPKSFPNQCTTQSKCLIFNCYKVYPWSENKKCVHISDIYSSDDSGFYSDSDVEEEHILNVGMISGATIAGREFIAPLSPLYQPFNHSSIDCAIACKDNTKGCACTHSLKVPFGKTIQVTFSNIENPAMASTEHSHHGSHVIGHPMHIHGNRFAVIDQGFGGSPSSKDNKRPTNNPDIKCDTDLCRNPAWADKKVKKLERKRPPLKDTIIVPPSGYAVVRMRVENAGYWFLHCHVMRDQLDGMAMLVEVAPEKVGLAPSDHPICHTEAFQSANNQFDPARNKEANVNGRWIPMVILAIICLGGGLLIGVLAMLWCQRYKRKRAYITDFPQHIMS